MSDQQSICICNWFNESKITDILSFISTMYVDNIIFNIMK